MKVLRNLGIMALVALSAMAAPDSSAQDLKIHLVVATVSQDSPLHVVGFKLPKDPGDPLRIIFHNVSPKTIERLWVHTLIGDPTGNGGLTGPKGIWPHAWDSRDINSQWAMDWRIPAHQYTEIQEKSFRTINLVMQTRRFRSACLRVVLVVASVRFSDGTYWMMKEGTEQEAWNNSIHLMKPSSCTNSPELTAALNELSEVGFDRPGPQPHWSQDTISFYSITCNLGKRDGKWVAICPL
jgi:hypothetical protein